MKAKLKEMDDVARMLVEKAVEDFRGRILTEQEIVETAAKALRDARCQYSAEKGVPFEEYAACWISMSVEKKIDKMSGTIGGMVREIKAKLKSPG